PPTAPPCNAASAHLGLQERTPLAMALPTTVSFTLEGKAVVPAAIFRLMTPAQQAQAKTFGPEHGGTFVIRWPTIRDRIDVDPLLGDYIQRMGIGDLERAPEIVKLVAEAIHFFDVLGQERPAWAQPNGLDDGLLVTAMLRAKEVAEETFLEAKKKSV